MVACDEPSSPASIPAEGEGGGSLREITPLGRAGRKEALHPRRCLGGGLANRLGASAARHEKRSFYDNLIAEVAEAPSKDGHDRHASELGQLKRAGRHPKRRAPELHLHRALGATRPV